MCIRDSHRTVGILPQDSRLAILELDLAVAGKPFEIQAYQRIFIKGVYQILRTGLYGIDRRGDLVKALIFLCLLYTSTGGRSGTGFSRKSYIVQTYPAL